MLQQILQQSVWQSVFIRPRAVAENASHLFAVCLFDFLERGYDRPPNILRNLSHIVPVMSFRYNERMELFFGVKINVIAIFGNGFFRFLVVNVTYPLEEHQRKNVLLICACIDIRAEQYS